LPIILSIYLAAGIIIGIAGMNFTLRETTVLILGVVVGNAMRVPAVPAAQPEVIKENVWKSVTLRSKLSYYRTGDWLDRNLPHQ